MLILKVKMAYCQSRSTWRMQGQFRSFNNKIKKHKAESQSMEQAKEHAINLISPTQAYTRRWGEKVGKYPNNFRASVCLCLLAVDVP